MLTIIYQNQSCSNFTSPNLLYKYNQFWISSKAILYNLYLYSMKSSSGVNSSLQQHFACPICLQHYNIQTKFPRVLMCGHTMCQSCICLIIGQKDDCKCPICKSNLGQQRIGLTYKNYSLMSIMESNLIKNNEVTQGDLIYIICKQTYSQIVTQMTKAPKHITTLIIQRLRDEKDNAFDKDLVRSNKQSMRFYKLLIKFYRLKHFELWVKYSAHGFEQCLAETLFQMESLETVKIVNAYDEYNRMRDVIPLTGNQKITFDIQIRKWSK